MADNNDNNNNDNNNDNKDSADDDVGADNSHSGAVLISQGIS